MSDKQTTLSERFNVDYIEKEAGVLLKYLGKRKKKKNIYFDSFSRSPAERRIMEYWGIR